MEVISVAVPQSQLLKSNAKGHNGSSSIYLHGKYIKYFSSLDNVSNAFLLNFPLMSE